MKRQQNVKTAKTFLFSIIQYPGFDTVCTNTNSNIEKYLKSQKKYSFCATFTGSTTFKLRSEGKHRASGIALQAPVDCLGRY